MRLRFSFLAKIGFLAGLLWAPLGMAACSNVPEGDPAAIVTVCEFPHTYEFIIGDQTSVYDKRAYQNQLGTTISSWLASLEPIGAQIAPDASMQIEFWLSVPEADPEAAQARAVVSSGARKFIVSLPINPDGWSIAKSNVGVLPQDGFYPEQFGFRAGSLLVKKTASASEEEFLRFVAEIAPSAELTNFSAAWYGLQTMPFTESRLLTEIANKAGEHTPVERVNFNSIMEWIARRQRVFAFSFNSNE